MSIRSATSLIYRRADTIAVIFASAWGSYVALLPTDAVSLRLDVFIPLSVLALVSAIVALVRCHRQLVIQSGLERMAKERKRRERELAEQPTQKLPVFLPQIVLPRRSEKVYVSCKDTAEDELRLAYIRDLDTPTGDIRPWRWQQAG